MSAHKSIDKICISIVAVTVALAILFCNGKALGIETQARTIGYENRLFDNTKVHTFDIVINDWESFIETCESEIYSSCNVVIDGELIKNVGIRGKGNTSLSSVKNMNSSRYSFKIEFDQYDKTKSYHGLDKLCLNNIIQDNTYMKDYLAYTLMGNFGVDAPLCSFVYITVNGEDWGLYLAVEAIEESFLERNYGTNYGDLYKPDSMSFGGGGPGNGQNFSMTDFINENTESDEDADTENSSEGTESGNGFPGGGNFDFSDMPDMGNFDMSNMPNMGDFDPSSIPNMDFGDFDMSSIPGFGGSDSNPDGSSDAGTGEKSPVQGGFGGFGGFGGGFGMGSDDVKLKYIDDDADSYSNIFNNAKTTVNTADKNRLISSLKALTEQSDIENTVDVDEVIRYFVVHIFLCNGDSYTGSMIHNYYLYEKDGQLSMIPWDYNLAYGSFTGGAASSSVNSAIDTPVSGDMSDRPMVSWIFDNEEYTEMYHEYFKEFLNSVDLTAMIEETAALIDEYVEKDPTKFCTYEEFQTGVEAIKQFCELRAESVEGQLNGTIPSTSAGQSADSSSLIDTNGLNTSDMGSMGSGGFGGGNRGGFGGNTKDGFSGSNKDSFGGSDKVETGKNTDSAEAVSATFTSTGSGTDMGGFGGGMSGDFDPSQFGGGNMPGGFDPSQFGGGNMPDGFDPSQFGGGNMPDGFDPSQFGGGNMPGGFDQSQLPDGFDASQFSGGNTSKQETSENDTSENSTSDADNASDGKSDVKDAGSSKPSSGRTGSSSDRTSSDKSGFNAGSFSGFGGSSQGCDSTEYILLGVSAAVLLLGILVAAVFKRRK